MITKSKDSKSIRYVQYSDYKLDGTQAMLAPWSLLSPGLPLMPDYSSSADSTTCGDAMEMQQYE